MNSGLRKTKTIPRTSSAGFGKSTLRVSCLTNLELTFRQKDVRTSPHTQPISFYSFPQSPQFTWNLWLLNTAHGNAAGSLITALVILHQFSFGASGVSDFCYWDNTIDTFNIARAMFPGLMIASASSFQKISKYTTRAYGAHHTVSFYLRPFAPHFHGPHFSNSDQMTGQVCMTSREVSWRNFFVVHFVLKEQTCWLDLGKSNPSFTPDVKVEYLNEP